MKQPFRKYLLIILTAFFSQLTYSQDTISIKLLNAIIENNKEEAKLLIKKGANVNYADSNGASILMWAAYRSDLDFFKWLHKSGAKTGSKGVIYTDTLKSYYGSLVCIAAGEGKLDLLKYLVDECKLKVNEREYNLESKQNDGWTALQWASCNNQLNTVEFLITKKAHLNLYDNSHQTALYITLTKGYLSIAKLLINSGADVNIINNEGWSPLHLAARDNYIDIAALLIYKGTVINRQNNNGWTPLMLSSYNDNFKMCHLLLRYGADTSLFNKKNQSASHLAKIKNNEQILSLFYQFDSTCYYTGIAPFLEKKGEDLHSIYLSNKDYLLNNPKSKFRIILPDGHRTEIRNLIPDKAGKRLLSYSWDGTVKYWDVKTGMLLKSLQGHTDNVTDAGISPDDKVIFTCSVDNPNRLWNALNGEPLSVFYEEGLVNSSDKLIFLSDGNRVLSSSGGLNGLVVRDRKTFYPIDFIETPLKISFYQELLESDKKYLIGFCKWDSLLIRIDLDSMKVDSIITGVTHFSKTNIVNRFIIVGQNGLLQIVNSRLHQIATITLNSPTNINTSGLSKNGEYIFFISDFGKMKLYDIISRKIIFEKSDVINGCFIDSNNFSITDSFHLYALKISGNQTKEIFKSPPEINNFGNLIVLPTKKDILFSASKRDQHKIFRLSLDNKIILYEFRSDVSEVDHALFAKNENQYLITTQKENLYKYGIAESDIQLIKAESPLYKNQDTILYNYDCTRTISIHYPPIDNKKKDSFELKIYNSKTKELIQELRGSIFFLGPMLKKAIVFSKDEEDRSNICIYNLETGSKITQIIRSAYNFHGCLFNSDENRLLTWDENWSTKLWDANTGEFLHEFGKMPYVVFKSLFINSEKDVLAATIGTVRIWDIKTKKLIKDFDIGYNSTFCDINEARNELLAIYNNEIKTFDLESGRLKFSIYIFQNLSNVVFLPSNYYKASTEAVKNLHFISPDLQIIPFDQLDIKYNRPDKVLEAIGSTDTALINSYRQAYYKRIKKLGVDTTSFKEGFTIPEADFKNRDQVEYEQKNKVLKLQVSGKSTESLDRFNVWINEVPLYGQKGISLRNRNKKIIDTTITVALSEGDNQVETSVTDVNGIESYRQPLFVKYVPEKPASPKTYFIGIGINRFADSTHNLSWSVKDIRDLSNRFAAKGAVIDTLFDENVTQSAVISLKKKLEGTSEEDKVIIAYSGHGLLSKEYDYYLSTYSVDFNQPEKNGLPYDELESLLDGIKARKKLMLIDACHSGEVDKEEMQHYKTVEDTLKNNNVKKGIILENKDQSKLGMKNSFELMQELFVNVGRSTGATIISAAAGTQFALERNDLMNGVFTYSLLELMNRNSTLKISDLKQAVTEKVPQLTGGLQKPTFRNENQQFDWTLW